MKTLLLLLFLCEGKALQLLPHDGELVRQPVLIGNCRLGPRPEVPNANVCPAAFAPPAPAGGTTPPAVGGPATITPAPPCGGPAAPAPCGRTRMPATGIPNTSRCAYSAGPGASPTTAAIC